MTVGISFDNGLEAIVVTDSRGSTSQTGRETDSFDKMVPLDRDNYTGVIYGTGSSNVVFGIFSEAPNVENEDLDGFVESLFKIHNQRCHDAEAEHIERINHSIKVKAALYAEGQERDAFIAQERHRAQQAIDHGRSNIYGTSFMIVAYDKNKNRIRKFSMNGASYVEVHISNTQIGSGSDGAEMYFMTKLPGVDAKKLRTRDVAFYAINAYSLSTVNQGVGGAPKIAHVSERGVEFLSREQVAAMANLSGAYLAEAKEGLLTNRRTRRYMGEVLCGEEKYGVIARVIGLNREAFTGLAIPLSTWQEHANANLFPQARNGQTT